MNVSTQLSAFVLLFSAIVAVMCLIERRRTRVTLAFVVWLTALGLARGGYIFNKLTGEGFLITAIGYLALFAATPSLAMVASKKKVASYAPLWIGSTIIACLLVFPLGAPLVDPKILFRATTYRAIGLGLFAASALYALFILQRSHGSRAWPLTGVAALTAIFSILEALWPWRVNFPPLGTALGIVVIFLAYNVLVREERLGRNMLVRAIAFTLTALLLAALYGFLVYRQGDRPALFVINTLAASFAVLLLYEPIMGWIERRATRIFEQRRDRIQRVAEQILSQVDKAANMDEFADALLPAFSGGIAGIEIRTPSTSLARGTNAGDVFEVALDESGGLGLNVWFDARREAEAKRLIDAIRGQLKYKLEIIELAKRFAEQEKMAAIGALASGLAHQLKNPLSALGAALEFERTGENDELIKSQAERINAIISRFFDFARPLEPKRETTDLAKLIDRLVEHVKGSPENAGLEVELALSEPAAVDIDPDLFAEALINLLRNAAAATDNKGPVRIALRAEDGRVTIEVEDAGQGIPPRERESIFEPFYTKAKGGTGLGLAITKKIVEAHGGRIWVGDSSLGGARFVIELPKGEG